VAHASVVDRRDSQPSTLGDVLYADKTRVPVSESTWVGLVQSIAERDQLALHALYAQTYGAVFTWIMRITGNWDTAEELMLDVFHDVWRTASTYDPPSGSVVGWIMHQARSRAIARRRFEQRTSLPPADVLVSSTADSLSPSTSLWEALARRIAAETGQQPLVPAPEWRAGPEWEEVAPGISCKLLATDREQDRVSMLVSLAPGVAYPPHTHAGIEELYLLHGELMIEDRKLYPGDYNRAEPGTGDQFVWSGTGCMCVLLTSTRDLLTTAAQTPSQSVHGPAVATPHIAGRVKRDQFRLFLNGLSTRGRSGGAYCLDCLSEMYSEPSLTVARYLDEVGISSRQGTCANCNQRRETFRSDRSS
jgi:DNA-directed RNA polymerase specialized sigma24 family protein